MTASMLEFGEMAMLNMNAGSTPRRSSAMRAQFEVEKTRMRVPVSLAVARNSPSALRSMARKAEECAGMMLTLPESSSTSWILPGDLPGKTTIFEPKQHRPRGLSAVSKTDVFVGGDENAYRWTLFCNATTIRDFVRRTRRTAVFSSSVIAAFCFASSQMTTFHNSQ